MIKMRKAEKCRGEFEQLARYTTRYQDSDLHLAFILLNLVATSTYTARFSVLPTSLLLLYFCLYQFKYSSGFNSQSRTCLGQLTGKVSIVLLIANTATGLLLSGNRSAYAQPQLISTKERRSALTPQTRPPVTFLIWQ